MIELLCSVGSSRRADTSILSVCHPRLSPLFVAAIHRKREQPKRKITYSCFETQTQKCCLPPSICLTLGLGSKKRPQIGKASKDTPMTYPSRPHLLQAPPSLNSTRGQTLLWIQSIAGRLHNSLGTPGSLTLLKSSPPWSSGWALQTSSCLPTSCTEVLRN